MGRDLTPKEMYLMEQQIIDAGLGSLWDFMANLTVTHDGVTSRLYTPDDLAKRKQNPFLGRLFEPYDELYSFLSRAPGGLALLSRYEKELNDYIKTGHGNLDSPLIKWYEGKLDPHFHYRETNNKLFFAAVQDEMNLLRQFDPKSGCCFWFPLDEEKCISVWFSPDSMFGDHLSMKLEARGEDGSMGPHCEVLIDERYDSDSLSREDICRCLQEVYADADLGSIAQHASHELTNKIMSVFGLNKCSLEEQISNASEKTNSVSSSHNYNFKAPER